MKTKEMGAILAKLSAEPEVGFPRTSRLSSLQRHRNGQLS